jgi:hypothetical protein
MVFFWEISCHGGRTKAPPSFSSNVYATSDSGASWQLLGPLPNTAYLTDIGHRSDTHWYGTDLAGCIHESWTGGASWSARIFPDGFDQERACRRRG